MTARPINTSPVNSQLEQALFAAFMAVLIWAPLPFASNRVWGGALLVFLLLLLLCGWLLLFLTDRARIDEAVWKYTRLPLLLLLLVQIWAFLQLLYLPASWLEFLSAKAHFWHIKEGWLSLSLDREIGKYFLLRGIAYCAGFFLVMALINSYERVKLLLQILVISGLFQALYGSFMVLSGMELSFFVEKYVGKGVATGTFINRNHLAGYLVMCLSAGIGLFLSQLSKDGARSWRDFIRRWLSLLLSSKIRLRVYLAVMVVALVLTRSRMGNMAFLLSLAITAGIAVYAGRQISIRLLGFIASLFVVDILILGKWFGFEKLLARLEGTDLASESRLWSNEYSLDYLADYTWTGSGGGSFYGIFPHYQSAELLGFHPHAHNDYLQFAIELGLPATALLLAVVILALTSGYRLLQRRTPLYVGAGFAGVMTLVWAAIHSTADFNLQIPANALTFVVIVSLVFVCRGLPARRDYRQVTAPLEP